MHEMLYTKHSSSGAGHNLSMSSTDRPCCGARWRQRFPASHCHPVNQTVEQLSGPGRDARGVTRHAAVLSMRSASQLYFTGEL